MTMRRFDNDFIDFYLEQLGVAAFLSPACYQIESIGAQLFSQIKGCHYGILGVPLLELMAILREHGLSPLDTKFRNKSKGVMVHENHWVNRVNCGWQVHHC